jgi:hypothetical protein
MPIRILFPISVHEVGRHEANELTIGVQNSVCQVVQVARSEAVSSDLSAAESKC